MNWNLIQKNPVNQPLVGTYVDWKQQIAIECFNQCVYCAIHENSMGGIRNFHVEHYRPKSKFKDKENDYLNLFYSCAVCNTFKNNDWPNEPTPDNSRASYPNPSEIDYNFLFEIDHSKGLIEGKNIAAKYIQEKLFLNRPQLITERRINLLYQRGDQEVEETRKLLEKVKDDRDYRELSSVFMQLWSEFNALKSQLQNIPRYDITDVTRPVQ